ncbi:MAG: glycosyltransferase family 2 protein [Mycoplasmoidaceae bacterium]
MKTFSIITPVYNGAKYISKCIEAVIHANYPLSNIEHIIIDDGSTDTTKQICEHYAKQYKHIKFHSKANGNWGSVINYVKAKQLAKNDYVVICDADDQLLPQSFYTVNKNCENVDLFVSGFYRWNGKKKKVKIIPYFFLTKKKLTKQRQWQYHTPLIVPQSGWIKNKIFYETETLREGVAYQDTVLFTSAFLASHTIKYTTKATSLYWCARPGNSMSFAKQELGLEKMTSNFDLYAERKWINPFFYYVIGMKKIRMYLKRHNLSYDFGKKKVDYSGFPIYTRPFLWLLYLIMVKRFIKK